MSRFKYVGDSPRVYPDFGLQVSPGDVVDLPENTDPLRFEAVADDAPATQES